LGHFLVIKSEMHKHFVVIVCLCAIISYSPLLMSEWWHVHCLWGCVSFWFLCDLFIVGSDLKRAQGRIEDLTVHSETLDSKLKFTEILKKINENDMLLMEIRSRVILLQRRNTEHHRHSPHTLVSNSL